MQTEIPPHSISIVIQRITRSKRDDFGWMTSNPELILELALIGHSTGWNEAAANRLYEAHARTISQPLSVNLFGSLK